MPNIKSFGDVANYVGVEAIKGFGFAYVGGQAGKYIGPKLSSLFGWSQQAFTNNIAGSAVVKGELIEWAGEVGVKSSYGKLGGSVGSGVANFADDFAKIPAKGVLDPSKIRFSQNNISSTFRNGNSINELTDGLKNGTINPSDIDPIRLVSKDGMTFSLDNRRLFSFQQAGVDIPYIKLDKIPFKQLSKFSTANNGINIIIR